VTPEQPSGEQAATGELRSFTVNILDDLSVVTLTGPALVTQEWLDQANKEFEAAGYPPMFDGKESAAREAAILHRRRSTFHSIVGGLAAVATLFPRSHRR